MATLLNSVAADTTGTGASHSAPATVYVSGTFDGAFVDVEISSDDSVYLPIDSDRDGKNLGPIRGATSWNVA